MRRVYLDNAATTFPKPEEVYAAVDQYQRSSGVAVGRGTSVRAIRAGQVVDQCRAGLAGLLGVPQPERFVFGYSGTDLLNTALQGLLAPGDRVVYTALEHNSVLRPLHELRDRIGLQLVEVPATSAGTVTVESFRSALESRPRLAVFSHASNVSGAILPVVDFVDICHRAGAIALLDACQSAGHVPFSLTECPVDLWVSSGHKHLLGPLGTGVLYLREGLEESLRPFRFGGTGGDSESERQPATPPARYEAGNHNAPGLHGLAAAVNWLGNRSQPALTKHEQELTGLLLQGLERLPGITRHGPPAGPERLGVVSITVHGLEPQEVAMILDQHYGIETRAGLHCSPRAHRALGTLAGGGTIRLSTGPFSTVDEIACVLTSLEELAAGADSFT